jgi:HEAT repeat protein
VVAWVEDVEISAFSSPGLDVLVSAGPQVMPELTHLLLHGETTETQAKAAFAMGAIAYRNQDAVQVHDAVPSLIKAAESPDRMVRICSVQALGATGKAAKKSTPVLLRLTKDENDGVRMCAVEALGRIGATSPESVAALRLAMSDSSDDVRLTASQALEAVQRGHEY